MNINNAMLIELQKNLDRLQTAIHNVGRDPYFSMYCSVQFSPVDQQELSEVMKLLPVSNELLSWYGIGAPVEFYLNLFTKSRELMLADPRSLIEWQIGFRWDGLTPDSWTPEKGCIFPQEVIHGKGKTVQQRVPRQRRPAVNDAGENRRTGCA